MTRVVSEPRPPGIMSHQGHWYRIRVKQADVARGELNSLFRELQGLVKRHSASVALFARVYYTRDSDIFVSPDAVEYLEDILDASSATPCKPPRDRGLSLLVGDRPASWCLLD